MDKWTELDRIAELEEALATLKGSISAIHAGYAKQLASKQEAWESVITSYHQLLGQDDKLLITEQSQTITELRETNFDLECLLKNTHKNLKLAASAIQGFNYKVV